MRLGHQARTPATGGRPPQQAPPGATSFYYAIGKAGESADKTASAKRSRPQPRSSSVMTKGGASRIVEPWVSLASTPSAASRSQTARPDSDANVTPAQRPRPVTDDTTDDGKPASRSCSDAPSTADRCWYSPVRSIAITSRATAHASGLPPNVEPCW